MAELEASLSFIHGIGDSARVASASDAIIQAYWMIARDSAALSSVLGETTAEFYASGVRAQSAAQVSQAAAEVSVRFQLLLAAQNERLLEQNEAVIGLLRTIADRLRPPSPPRR